VLLKQQPPPKKTTLLKDIARFRNFGVLLDTDFAESIAARNVGKEEAERMQSRLEIFCPLE
jgi:hypothetical protein